MSDIPYRLQNGEGNPPDADKFMANFDWLTAIGLGDFLNNGGFEYWTIETSYTNPSNGQAITAGWTLRKSGTANASADISRESSITDSGTYSCKINLTGAGSADCLVALDQSFIPVIAVRGMSLAIGFKVRAATGNKVRIKVTDGSTTAYSSYHSGGGTFEHLYTVISVNAAATAITISVEITGDFTGAVYVDGGYTYIVPSSMTATARALLASFPLAGQVGINGQIWYTPDGQHAYRIGIDDNGDRTKELLF